MVLGYCLLNIAYEFFLCGSDHWTLTVIDPDNDTVYFMDPVRRRIPCGDWAKIVKE